MYYLHIETFAQPLAVLYSMQEVSIKKTLTALISLCVSPAVVIPEIASRRCMQIKDTAESIKKISSILTRLQMAS
jgi:hypothetical protein